MGKDEFSMAAKEEERIESFVNDTLKKIADEGFTAKGAESIAFRLQKTVINMNRENAEKAPFTYC